MLGLFRPLIEAGRIVPITQHANLCLHCAAKGSLGKDANSKFDSAYKYFTGRFAKELKFTLRNAAKGRFHLDVFGNTPLIEHNVVLNLDSGFKEVLKDFHHARKTLDEGGEVQVSKTLLERAKIPHHFSDILFDNIAFELATSQCLSTGLITSNPTDIEIVEKLSGDIRMQKRNKIIQELLTSVVPLISEMTPEELLRLRENEGDSFVLFRAALSKAADNVKQEGAVSTRNDAESLYLDVIAPELAKLNIAVQKARKGMLKNARRSVLGWTAAISFGVYYGFIPERLREAAQTLGFTKILADLATKFMGDSDVEETIRSENMYFLWKVQQTASQKL